jgi:hypothetical protein
MDLPRDGFTACMGGDIYDKAKKDKMRYSNLSNNMIISELLIHNNYNSNTVVDGRVAHMTDTTRQSAPEHPPPPLPDHAGSIPGLTAYALLDSPPQRLYVTLFILGKYKAWR